MCGSPAVPIISESPSESASERIGDQRPGPEHVDGRFRRRRAERGDGGVVVLLGGVGKEGQRVEAELREHEHCHQASRRRAAGPL